MGSEKKLNKIIEMMAEDSEEHVVLAVNARHKDDDEVAAPILAAPTEKKTKKSTSEIKETKNGEFIKVRKGLPRSGKPIILPDVQTFIKQPNLVTRMAYDYQTIQLRIFISIMERLQYSINEQMRTSCPAEQLTLFKEFDKKNEILLQIPIKDFGLLPHRYPELKAALVKLATIPIELDAINPLNGEKSILIKGLCQAYISKEVKYARYVTISIDKDIAKFLVSADGGFTKFIKEIAYRTQNKYTVRIYMFISSWKDKGGTAITLSKFRKWLKLEKKYVEYKDLYKRVIRPAYEELFENSDCWFEVAEVTRPGEKEPYKLQFKIIKATLSVKEKEALELQKKNIESMLFTHLKMSDRQISKILAFVSLDNTSSIRDKIISLKAHVDKTPSISSVPNYCYTAIMEYIEEQFYDAAD